MTEINFYLKSQNATKSGKIIVVAQIAVNYKKYRKGVGSVKQREWNKRTQRLKLNSLSEKDYNSNLRFNKLLDEIENKAKDLFNKTLLEKRNPTESEITNLFFQSSKIDLADNNFFAIFDEFIKKSKAQKAERTITGYTTVKNFLDKFQTETNYIISWDSLNENFLDELASYMFIKLKKQNGYHAKIMAVLGTFLRWAKDRKYYSGDFYEKTKGKEPEKEVIFLPLNELLHLYSYEFENEKYTKIRDVYCFSCFTGLRFSDIESLKKEHIKSDHLLKFQQKTNDFKKVQLTPFAIEILEKYKDQAKLLPVISSQNTNKYLKECLGVIASKQKENEGFNQSVILRKEIGSKKTEEIVPKHKAITFHTGRKTFISNSIMLGMNIETLKEMGAPRKEEHLKKYKKITEKFQKEQLDNTWGKITINK